jgi:pyocin large subunit-like protein
MAKSLPKAQMGKAIKAGVKAAVKTGASTYKRASAEKKIAQRNFEKEVHRWPSRDREAYFKGKDEEFNNIVRGIGTGAAAIALGAAATKKKMGGSIKTKKK